MWVLGSGRPPTRQGRLRWSGSTPVSFELRKSAADRPSTFPGALFGGIWADCSAATDEQAKQRRPDPGRPSFWTPSLDDGRKAVVARPGCEQEIGQMGA